MEDEEAVGAVSPRRKNKRKEPPAEEDLVLKNSPETARMTFRMDPEESHSDWKIIIVHGSKEMATYHVHKVLLSIGMKRCMYFNRLFQNKRLKEHETSTSRIELNKLAAKAFPVMLDYLYSPSNKLNVKARNSVPLYHLAEFFDCPLLRSKVRTFWKEELHANDFAICYKHCKIFPDEKAYQAIVSEICDYTSHIELDSDLMKISDDKLWRDVLVKNNGEEDTHLSLLISKYCTDQKDCLSMEVFLQLVEESLLPVLDPDAAITLMEIEKGLFDAAAKDCHADELTSLQKRGEEALASADININDLKKRSLSPSVTSRVIVRSLELAQKELQDLRSVEDRLPISVRVWGAGLVEANGVYERSSEYDDGSLRFSKKEAWRGDSATFTICLGQPDDDDDGDLFWFISAGPDDDDAEETLYACELKNPETSGILMPPVVGWVGHSGAGQGPYLVYQYEVEE